MKNKDIKLSINAESFKALGKKLAHGLSRYAGILIFVLISGVYGFVLLRINVLSNAQPSQEAIDAQTTAAPVPRIDPEVARQLEELEDNSVNVQTLFNQARNNPFQ